MIAVLHKDHRAKSVAGAWGGQLCIPWDVLAIHLRVEKKPLPLPNWRCFPVRWVPVSDANGEAAGEGTSPTGRRACISIQIEISVLFAKGGGVGSISRGFRLYLWFYLFILKDLVRPKLLAAAKPSKAIPLSHSREQMAIAAQVEQGRLR